MYRQKEIKLEQLKLENGIVIIGSDIHIPFQDDKAVDAFCDYCKEIQPSAIILNGDVLDFYKLSRFIKGEGRNPYEEISACRDLLKKIKTDCPNSKVYYVIGNHETRLETYVLNNAPHLASLVEDVFTIIKTNEFGVIGCSEVLINDTFVCTHGKMLGSKAGLSAIKEIEKHYMSGASGHCFSEDVEILVANKGWIKVLDVQQSDNVATYNKQTGQFEWNCVRDKFVYDNYKELYHIKSSTIDLMVTDKHGLIGFNASNGRLEEFTAEELIKSSKRYNIPLACTLNENSTGVALSDDELRLVVNICADASIEDRSFRWHIKKERKIDHLVELLNRLNLKYSFNIQKTGNVKIRLLCEDSKKYLWLFDNSTKCLPALIACCNKAQAEIVLDEYSIADGHKNSSAKNSYQIYTNKKKEVDILQEMFVKNGMRTSVIKNDSGVYVITVNKRSLTTISKQNVTVVPYSGKVSCVSVDNGTLVVRSKGKTIITQNTHRLAKFITRKAGRKFVWLETGCLCDLNPEYVQDPDWMQGFAAVEFNNGKVKRAEVIEIENGEIL